MQEDKKAITEELIKKRLKAQNVKEPLLIDAFVKALSALMPGGILLVSIAFLLMNLYIKEIHFGTLVVDRSLALRDPLEVSFPVYLIIIFLLITYIVLVPSIYSIMKSNYDCKVRTIRNEILEEQIIQKQAIKEIIDELDSENKDLYKKDVISLKSKLEALKQRSS